MLELILKGRPRFYLWLCFLGAIIGLAFVVYLFQLNMGLTLTGLSRDVSWGLYIAQLTYFVGVAAGAVMLVLPAYFHHYEKFKRIIIFGEFMAVGAVLMCMLFVVVDLGQPQRMLNVMLHPTPNSILFWDMLVLCVYLVLNLIIGWVTLEAARNDVMPPKWIKVLIYISIIWAFSIHTVTGFLYAGVPGRHYWLTAIMAARFLASAFCSGPAILLLLLMIVRRVTGFEPGREATKTLSTIITYAMCVNVFFYLLELFTAFYSTNAARDLAQFSARFGTPLTCASIVLAHCMQRARRKISRLSAFRLSELHAYSRYHFWASCSGTSPYSPLSDSKSQIPLFNFFARPI